MAKIVQLPRLSDTMEEGVVAAWRIKVGDKVRRGQVIAEIETDKATMEFESFDSGTVLAIVADEGASMKIGSPIAVLGEPGEDPAQALATAVNPVTATASAPVAAPSTPAPSAVVPTAPEAPSVEPVAAPAAVEASPAESEAARRIPASPLARRLAREHGVALEGVSGSGPHGRIVKADVEKAATAAPAATGTESVSISTEHDEHGRPYVNRPSRKIGLSQMRKAIAKRMVQSKQEAPHFYLTIDVDMEACAAFRAQYNLAIEGAKVSYNDMLMSATAKALRKHPRVNATYHADGIVEHGDIHVGVAVALDDGLIVPVVRNAEQKTLRAISLEVRELGKRAKKKALAPQEMAGSTFTVSNLGMFGIDSFSAVVNPGEGAILAVGEVAEQACVVGGQLVIRKRMKATLSCDHRVVDGAVGAQFLQTLKDYLEHPMRLFT